MKCSAGGRRFGRFGTAAGPARCPAGSGRRAPCAAPRGGVAEPAVAGARGGVLAHHGLDRVLLAAASLVGGVGAARRGDGRGRRRVPPLVVDREQRGPRRRLPRLGSRDAGPSWPRYDVISSPARACCWSPARPGSGKTRLVDTAMGSAGDTFVARGACLPLSAQVPLLPVTDVLRSVYEVDQGQWVKMGIADARRTCWRRCASFSRNLTSRRRAGGPRRGRLVAAAVVLSGRHDLVGARFGEAARGAGRGPPLGGLDHSRPARVPARRLPGLPLVGTYRHSDPSTPHRDV